MTQQPTPAAAWYQQPDGTFRYFDGQQWGSQILPAPPAGAPVVMSQQPVQRRIVSDKEGKPVQATLAWGIAICTLGYMFPWALAATRGKSNAGMIGIVNLLLGWTVIGWVIALVMAAGTHQKVAV